VRIDSRIDARVNDAGHDANGTTDNSTDTANDQGTPSDVGRCSPTATCDLLTRYPPRDYSAPCETGVRATRFIGLPVACASIMFPQAGPIALSFAGVELHGSRENVVFDIYASGCNPLRRDHRELDRMSPVEYGLESGRYAFNLLPTRPDRPEYPDSGSEEVLMQTWATGCGADFLRPPVLTAAACTGREYHTVTVPLSEMNGRLKVGPYIFQAREISETVSEARGTTCEVSGKRVSLEIEAPDERFVYTLGEIQSVWQVLSDRRRCVYVGVGSINMHLGEPSSPGPGSPLTCPISGEYAVVTIQVPHL
jgi:hypothetical protein